MKRRMYYLAKILGKISLIIYLKLTEKIAPNLGGSRTPRKGYILLRDVSWIQSSY